MAFFTISLDNVLIHANHGILPQERVVGNDFIVDVSVIVPAPDTSHDSLENSVSYADIFEIVNSVMSVPAETLEFVAMKIRGELLRNFPQVESCKVKITKCAPPIAGMQGSASVTIE